MANETALDRKLAALADLIHEHDKSDRHIDTEHREQIAALARIVGDNGAAIERLAEDVSRLRPASGVHNGANGVAPAAPTRESWTGIGTLLISFLGLIGALAYSYVANINDTQARHEREATQVRNLMMDQAIKQADTNGYVRGKNEGQDQQLTRLEKLVEKIEDANGSKH